MRIKVLKNYSVRYNVPDGVKIEDGKSLYATITPDMENCEVNVTKKEKTGRKTSERNYLYQGKNFTLTLNTDDNIARGTLKLRANEDWKGLHDSIISEVEGAFVKLMIEIGKA